MNSMEPLEETFWDGEDAKLVEDRLRRARRDAHHDSSVNLMLPQLIELKHLLVGLHITVDEDQPDARVKFLPSPLTFDHAGKYYSVNVYVDLHPCMARMILSACNGQRLASLGFEPMHGQHNTGLGMLVGENADRSACPRINIMNYAKELEWISERIEAEWEAYVADHLTTVLD